MDLEEFIRRTWTQHYHTTLMLADRLVAHAALRGAPQTSHDGRLAREAAHRLAGSLGMYGLSEGSDVATSLEMHLAAPSDFPLSDDEFLAAAVRLRELIEAGPGPAED